MKTLSIVVGRMVLIASLGGFAPGAEPASAQTSQALRIVELVPPVEILPQGNTTWLPVANHASLEALERFRIRTGTNASLGILCSDRSVLRFQALSEAEILPPGVADADHHLNLIQGILSFFHRDQPSRVHVIASGGVAGIKGTEFVMAVVRTNGREQTTLSVIDGQVSFSNAGTTLTLTNGQQAVGEPGKVPQRTPGFIVNTVLQWCFYYPGLLDLNDLPLTAAETTELSESLTAYRAGDLLAALAKYPDARPPSSDADRIYHAALLLSAGQVEPAEAALDPLTATGVTETQRRLATALRTLIAAVKHESGRSGLHPQLPTELLATSYFEQSRTGPQALEIALELARRAVAGAPDFGFGWERVAELEFSFGRTDRAVAALDQALRLSPRNAQALALKGFLLAAQNQPREAIEWFDRALKVDSALGNAWLGRGLCRIRRGNLQAGREDLLIAAAMEPQRASLRSYLGKAFGDAGDTPRAIHELDLAKQMDINDPTAWLYSALLNEQNNRVNEAVRDLEKSQALNDQRGVYRSGLLLDQDRAVRSANLARIYAEAGLGDVALREAGESVAKNYTSYGSHLFLANAYQQNLAAGPFGRRYETPAFSEYLFTALLGPADGRLLSQEVSQQEYTHLFERDGAHLSSSTEYLSRGAWKQYGAQYGTFGDTSYAVEADYLSDPGQAANARLEFHSFSAKVKQMLTPKDSIFFQVYESSWEGGDTSQHYKPENTLAKYQFKEEQLPNLLVGYHHEWSADSHTLFLVSRFDDETAIFHPHGTAVLLLADPSLPPSQAAVTDLTRSFNRRYAANTVELQQAQKIASHTLVAGVRFQLNTERISNQDAERHGNLNGDFFSTYFETVPYACPIQQVQVENERASLYAFDYWQLANHWLLYGGMDADYLRLARNTIAPPLSTDHDTIHKISPKVGLKWTPCPEVALSLAYAQSVTGQDLDQSVRLEPTDFAGLPLTFRTAFPDSLVGGVSGEQIEVWQANGRIRLGKNTYGVLGLQHLQSDVDREVGSYTGPASDSGQPQPSHTRESLHFHEDSLQFSLRHLFADRCSAGLRYEVSHARLNQALSIDPAIFRFQTQFPASRSTSGYEGVLHSLTIDVLANLPNGLFAGADATWRGQTDLTDTALGGRLPEERFWQIDLSAGYRSPRRRFECLIGVLNVTGSDYRLHPINAFLDAARKPTLVVTTRFNF